MKNLVIKIFIILGLTYINKFFVPSVGVYLKIFVTIEIIKLMNFSVITHNTFLDAATLSVFISKVCILFFQIEIL